MNAVIPQIEYWKKHGDRAIVSRLVRSATLLDTQRDALQLARGALHNYDALGRHVNVEAFESHLTRSVSAYLASEGHFARVVERVGQQIDHAVERALIEIEVTLRQGRVVPFRRFERDPPSC